jgi:hypothetical protein
MSILNGNYRLEDQNNNLVEIGDVSLDIDQSTIEHMAGNKNIKILADEIVLKGDLKFPGKKITIIARNIYIPNSITINLDGEPGEPNYRDTDCASSGTNPGEPGKKGKAGGAGKNAGELIILAGHIEGRLNVTAKGGNGGRGQNGGNGAVGNVGGDGRDSDEDGSSINNTGTHVFLGTPGEPGGKGGGAGLAGKSGDGGQGGKIIIRTIDQSPDFYLENTSTAGGLPGPPALHGKPGKGGLGGRGGRNRKCHTIFLSPGRPHDNDPIDRL